MKLTDTAHRLANQILNNLDDARLNEGNRTLYLQNLNMAILLAGKLEEEIVTLECVAERA